MIHYSQLSSSKTEDINESGDALLVGIVQTKIASDYTAFALFQTLAYIVVLEFDC